MITPVINHVTSPIEGVSALVSRVSGQTCCDLTRLLPCNLTVKLVSLMAFSGAPH